MTVRLRLQRHGAKKRPFYRVVAADKRSPRDGRFIELLGTYDPMQEPPKIRLNSERINYWLGVGAQPSETVGTLIKRLQDGQAVDLSEEGAEAAAIKEQRQQKRQRIEAAKQDTVKRAQAEAEAAKKAAEAEAAEKAAEAEAAKKAAEAEKAEGDSDAPEAEATEEA